MARAEEVAETTDDRRASRAVPTGAEAASLPARGPAGGAWRTRALALVVAALVLFPLLATSGIWDPYELDAADLARRIAVNVFGAKGLELPSAQNALPTLSDLRMGELAFTSMALGFKALGLRDWAGRLPLALWALAGVAVLYEWLARLVDRRAGLYAAITLVTMPLYFMQARTMLGDIVTMVAFTMAFCGLSGAALDEGKARAAWLVLGLLGLGAGYLSRGLLLGVTAPALGVGFAWLSLRGAGEGRGRGWSRDAVGALALLIGAGALVMGLFALQRARPDAPVLRALGFALLKKPPVESTFDLVVRQLGHALFPWSALLPFAIGRLLRAPVFARDGAPASRDLTASRDAAASREIGVRASLLVGATVAYAAYALLAPLTGALPFAAPALLAAIIALAVLDLERGAPPSRALALGCVVLGLVLAADILREPEKAFAPFVVDKPQFPKSFEVTGGRLVLAALAAFAALTGLTWFEAQPEEPVRSPAAWLDGMIAAYRRGLAELAAIWHGNLLFGLVVVEAALVGLGAMIFVGRFAAWSPVQRLPKNFADVGLNAWWIVPFAAASAPALALLTRDLFRVLVHYARLPRASFTLIAGLVAGSVLGFGYYPALAAQLSPKEVFDAYARQHAPGEPLALLGVRGRAAAYYAGGEIESFSDPNQAFVWLTGGATTRRWMVVKADDLPKLNALYRVQNARNLPVLDGRSSQILLVSNHLGDRPNESWIGKLVLDEPPRPARPLDAAFDDQLEAIGWEVTDKDGRVIDSVIPQRQYRLRLYFRVLRPITGSWKVFIHIDGFQRRFNGDHSALDGKYPMNLWQPGDVVVDDFPFQLEPNFTPGEYTVYFGFFTGETRFRVTRGQEQDNRVVAGALRVR